MAYSIGVAVLRSLGWGFGYDLCALYGGDFEDFLHGKKDIEKRGVKYYPPNNYYRLTDFDGYDHYQVSPFSQSAIDINTPFNQYATPISVVLRMYPQYAGGITFYDFQAIRNYYLCVMCIQSSTIRFKTSSLSIAEATTAYNNGNQDAGNMRVTVSASELGNSSAEYFVFLSNKKQTTFTSNSGIAAGGFLYAPIPMDNPAKTHGNITYQAYVAPPVDSTITIWGIQNYGQWEVYMGLESTDSTFRGYSNVNPNGYDYDYNYNIIIGFSVKNNSTSQYLQKELSDITLGLTTNFGGQILYSVDLYGTVLRVSSASTRSINIVGYDINIPPSQTHHFIIRSERNDVMCSPYSKSDVTRGQTIRPEISVSLYRAGSGSKYVTMTN